MAVFYNTDNLPEFKNAVVTIGTFDGVHLGHRVILQEVVKHAKEINGESVLLTFEPHPRKLLFPDQSLKLLTPLDEKIKLIQSEGIENIVVVPFTNAFANLSADEYIQDFLVRLFKPHGIVIGYDHHFGHDRKGNINLLKQEATKYHYSVFEIPAQLIDEAAVSSTKIRNALNEGHVTEAAHMLGYNYTMKGTVQKGAQLGRTINYPTANLLPSSEDQLIPARGVYAIKVNYNGIAYKAMLNIGFRPTVSNELKLHIEAHIFDFNGDIYGKEIELEFIERLRDEQKFASLDELKAQLGKDKEAAQRILQ